MQLRLGSKIVIVICEISYFYPIMCHRTGKTGRLVIRTNGRPDAVYGAGVQSPGRATVLNLDQQLTQFLIGGSPSVIRVSCTVLSISYL